MYLIDPKFQQNGMGCCPGLGAVRLTIADATRVNGNLSSQYNWALQSGSNYSDVTDPKLAEDVYEFQHDMLGCSDDLPGDLGQSISQCEGRDGMAGSQTIQGMFNATQEAGAATPGSWGAVWVENIRFPPGMTVKPIPKIPCGDLSARALARRGDCPQGGGDIDTSGGLKTKDVPVEEDGGSWWIWGLLAVGVGAGAYYYTKKK